MEKSTEIARVEYEKLMVKYEELAERYAYAKQTAFQLGVTAVLTLAFLVGAIVYIF